MNDIDAVDGLT